MVMYDRAHKLLRLTKNKELGVSISRKLGRPADLSWQPRFLELLTQSGNMQASARSSGVSNSMVRYHMQKDMEFRIQVEQARLSPR